MTADHATTARPIPTYTDRMEAAKQEAENDRLRGELDAVRSRMVERVSESHYYHQQLGNARFDLERVTADRDRLAAACAAVDRELSRPAALAGDLSPAHWEVAQALAATGWPGYRQDAASAEPRMQRELPLILAAIDNALRNGSHMTGANLAFEMLCDHLGVDSDGLDFRPDWAAACAPAEVARIAADDARALPESRAQEPDAGTHDIGWSFGLSCERCGSNGERIECPAPTPTPDPAPNGAQEALRAAVGTLGALLIHLMEEGMPPTKALEHAAAVHHAAVDALGEDGTDG